MKTIKNINIFAIALPLAILITYPIFKEGALLFSVLSTMITGFIQIILGIIMLTNEPDNKYLKTYLIFVVSFFFLWYINSAIGYTDILTFFIVGIPPILAIYLSIIIYKKAKDENTI